jgi:transposase-like protein
MVVAACRKPGVSIASVALDHRLNANLVRRWVVTEERAGQVGAIDVAQPSALPAMPAFVPMAMERSVVATSQEIVIELRRGPMLIKLTWPLAAANACSAWLRDLLR